MSNTAPWGGRFAEALSDIAFRFSSSIDVDGKLYREDIEGSLAHVEMLGACGVLSSDEVEAIARGLGEIREEIDSGTLILGDGAEEDVHMAIEVRLIEKIGSVGGKLHTARSRNDQVALDERLWLRRTIDAIVGRIDELKSVLLDRAEEHASTLMPGYTHLQRAQPVLLGHHLLAYVSMLERDRERLLDCRRRANRSPLGAAALGGTSFPIDREMVAERLGFDGIVENSIDAVSDRDHLIEFISACSIAMMHLSRLAEEMVIWSSKEFSFVRLGDDFTTGSSIMPQKKNPDMAELVRGRTGRVYGALVSLLTTMKGLPLAYNRDMQEDKVPLFDAAETLESSLAVFSGMLAGARFDVDKMEEGLADDFSTATEIADYLVRRGLPFREAHHVTGSIVRHCIDTSTPFSTLDMETLRGFSPHFESDILLYLDPRTSIAQKRSSGSTSPAEVERQIRKRRVKGEG